MVDEPPSTCPPLPGAWMQFIVDESEEKVWVGGERNFDQPERRCKQCCQRLMSKGFTSDNFS